MCKFSVGDVSNSSQYGENHVFKFDQSEAVYCKFCVDDVNNCRKNCRCSGTCIKGNSTL